MTSRRRPWWRSRWWMPAVSLVLGAVVFTAFAVGGGGTADGLKAFGVMAVVAAVFWLGRGSDTLQGLGGPGRDERWAMIDLRATSLAGMATLTVILGAWLYEIASGRDGSPYGQLAAVGGLAYVAAVAFFRTRG